MKELPLKEFAKYSDEELKQELIRRRVQHQRDFYKKTNIWHYWYAVVVGKSNTHSRYIEYRYVYELKPVDSIMINKSIKYGLHNRKKFNSKNVPRIGDIVRLRCRIYVDGSIGYDRSKIIEVTKRSEL